MPCAFGPGIVHDYCKNNIVAVSRGRGFGAIRGYLQVIEYYEGLFSVDTPSTEWKVFNSVAVFQRASFGWE